MGVVINTFGGHKHVETCDGAQGSRMGDRVGGTQEWVVEGPGDRPALIASQGGHHAGYRG